MDFGFAFARGERVETWQFAAEQFSKLPASLTVIAVRDRGAQSH